MVRPANSLSSAQGQIRLTAQQLASLTSQQIVIRPSQNGSQQQILISRPATSVNSVAAAPGQQMQFTKVVGSPVGTSVQLSRPQVPVQSSVAQVSQVQFVGLESDRGDIGARFNDGVLHAFGRKLANCMRQVCVRVL